MLYLFTCSSSGEVGVKEFESDGALLAHINSSDDLTRAIFLDHLGDICTPNTAAIVRGELVVPKPVTRYTLEAPASPPPKKRRTRAKNSASGVSVAAERERKIASGELTPRRSRRKRLAEESSTPPPDDGRMTETDFVVE